MRKSRTETAETRARIVETASHLFRRDGIHATGLADIMAAAGLTHGGFYRHFCSKDQLVAEAFGAAFGAVAERVDAPARHATGKRALEAIAENYLARPHRDGRSGGCPYAAMGSELARADAETRAAATEGFRDLVDALARRMPRKTPAAARSDAAAMLSLMIGALTMSRIVDDAALSQSILRAAKAHLAAV